MPLKTLSHHRCAMRLFAFLLISALGLPVLAAGQPTTAPAESIVIFGAPPQPATQPADDESDVEVIQALDGPVNLNVTDTPILEVVQLLAQSSGIPIELQPGTLDLLPYGSKTLLSATVERRSLRETLTELLRQLALTFRPEGGKLLILPTEPLRRIARRATWEDLATLVRLNSTPWSPELANSLQFQFQDAKAGYADANRERLLEATEAVGAGSAADVLELACEKYGWAWAPSGEVIVIMSKTRLIERLLNKRATVNYLQIGIEQALLDLANKAGVLLLMEPGALASLPPQMSERFPLFMENATIQQTLQYVTGLTGLSFSIEPNGIRISAGKTGAAIAVAPTDHSSAEAALRAMRSNPVVGQINVTNRDGSTFSLFIREEDLPPEVNEMRKARVAKAVNQIRQTLASEQPND